jgi:pimeloyl-ACP methyl ester carboxylesterase
VLQRLRRTGRPAIAVDLPGFGEADSLKRSPILPQHDRFALAALKYAAEAGDGRVVAVGNSLGGVAALRLAERGDERLAGVVAVAPAGLDMGRWFVIIEGERLLRWLLTLPAVPTWMVHQVVGQMYLLLAFGNPSAARAETVRWFTSHFRDRRTVRRYLATGRRLLPEIRDPFRLERVSCPVMVVWGTADRMVYPSGAKRLKREAANVRVELIDGCGHCPQVEVPDRFVRLLTSFRPAAARRRRASTRS